VAAVAKHPEKSDRAIAAEIGVGAIRCGEQEKQLEKIYQLNQLRHLAQLISASAGTASSAKCLNSP
jgi:hypothetical protein